jgi:hypothetical protein
VSRKTSQNIQVSVYIDVVCFRLWVGGAKSRNSAQISSNTCEQAAAV